MSTTIKYKNFAGEITPQQATQLNDDYEKTHYVDGLRRKDEYIKKNGNIFSVTFYILPSEEESMVLQNLMQEYPDVVRFLIVTRTPIGNYFRERERYYYNGVLSEDSERLMTADDVRLYSKFIYSADPLPPNSIKITKYLDIYSKPGVIQTHAQYEFYYNDDGSFFGGVVHHYEPQDDYEVDTFEETIGLNNDIPNLPIKVEYFANGEIDPTGFEI